MTEGGDKAITGDELVDQYHRMAENNGGKAVWMHNDENGELNRKQKENNGQ